jgi:hypothetical protein
MRDLAVRGEFGFKPLELCSQYECARAEQTIECLAQLILDVCVLALKCDKAHDALARARELSCCLHHQPIVYQSIIAGRRPIEGLLRAPAERSTSSSQFFYTPRLQR